MNRIECIDLNLYHLNYFIDLIGFLTITKLNFTIDFTTINFLLMKVL